jgi:D-arabinose 1-dehydrogenase-like Zn-dependent alcohol dehydrogenase
MGNHTTVISTSDGKKESAMTHLKAHAFINSSHKDEMDHHEETFDFILNTVACAFDLEMYMKLLKVSSMYQYATMLQFNPAYSSGGR